MLSGFRTAKVSEKQSGEGRGSSGCQRSPRNPCSVETSTRHVGVGALRPAGFTTARRRPAPTRGRMAVFKAGDSAAGGPTARGDGLAGLADAEAGRMSFANRAPRTPATSVMQQHCALASGAPTARPRRPP